MLNLKSKWVKLSAGFGAGAVLLWASGIAPQAYNLIEGNGTPAAKASTLNFANTATVTWVCSTSAGVTACSATSSAGGSGNPTIIVANDAVTGTTTSTLTKFNGLTSSTAIIAATTDTGGVVGITTSGAGTSGNATVAIAGLVNCVFDGATTVNDYVQISSSTNGDCTDAGSTYPTSHQVIGRVMSTNVTAGTYQIDLFPAEIRASSGGSGGGFIQPLTAPVAANFSDINFNTGGAVTTQTNNSSPVTSINLKQHDPGGSQEIVGLVKAKLAATFTITAAFTIAGDVTTEPVAGLWLTDSTPAANITWGFFQNGGGLAAILFNSISGSFSGFLYDQGTPPWTQGGPLAWFRIQETASARNYYTSSDGINFNLILTESNTAHFTTANYGFATTTRNGGVGGEISITLYSFTETNP